MAKQSAGILMFRLKKNCPEVFLVHPGGPFFRNKDLGSWTIPKGLPEDDEELETSAIREFEEETGIKLNTELQALGEVKQAGGKIVHAWATQADLPEDYELKSNHFRLEWPPKSGKTQEFPEIDQAFFFDLDTARQKINPAQIAFLDRLEVLIEKAGNDEKEFR